MNTKIKLTGGDWGNDDGLIWTGQMPSIGAIGIGSSVLVSRTFDDKQLDCTVKIACVFKVVMAGVEIDDNVTCAVLYVNPLRHEDGSKVDMLRLDRPKKLITG